MENRIQKEEGNIFFIPLFLGLDIKDNNKNYSKYKFLPSENYAFGRLIEIDSSGGDLVEIFKYIGTIPSNASEIVNSGLLLDPIHVSLAFNKKRWQFIFEGQNYNKSIQSNYENIKFLLGIPGNAKLWKGGVIKEIENYSMNEFNEWIVYPPTKVEKLIIEKINGK